MRIMCVTVSLGPGGAEGTLARLAGAWVERGHDVVMTTIHGAERDFHRLDTRVERIALRLQSRRGGPLRGSVGNLRRLRALRAAIRRFAPEVVVSFLTTPNVLSVLAAAGTGAGVVISERTEPRGLALRPPWSLLRRMLYRRAGALVVPTEALRVWAAGLVGSERVYVIPNPVEVCASTRLLSGRRTVAALGRLHPVKGFDILVRAFAAAGRPGWCLVVWGEGPERARLEALAGHLGVSATVRFPGRTTQPAVVLREADLFVLPSRREAFPNALVEAMACGLPVVAADCPSGPREVVADGVDGVLVPPEDVDALAAAMGRLMDDEEERERLGAAAVRSVERFSPHRVLDRWDEVLARVAGGRA